MPDPLVSVLLTSYNREKTIRVALESVQKQTFQDFELICSDDGSTDGTIQILKDSPIENKVILTSEFNQGIPKNRNKALAACRGKYIAILDSDDAFYLNKLEEQVRYLEANPDVEMTFSAPQLMGPNLELLPESLAPSFYKVSFKNRFEWLRYFYFKANCICNSSTMIRRDCLTALGAYNEAYNIGEDFDLFIRFFLAGHRVYVLDYPLTFYRIHPDRITQPTEEKIPKSLAFLVQILKDRFFSIEDTELLRQIFPEIKSSTISMMRYDLATLSEERDPYFHQKMAFDVKEFLLSDPNCKLEIETELERRRNRPLSRLKHLFFAK